MNTIWVVGWDWCYGLVTMIIGALLTLMGLSVDGVGGLSGCNNFGCHNPNELAVRFDPPDVSFTVPSGTSKELFFEVDGGVEPYTFDWSWPCTDYAPTPHDSTRSCTFTVVGDIGASYEITLKVKDHQGRPGEARITAIVGPSTTPPDTNHAPVAALSATPTSGNAPFTVNFDASASTYDGDRSKLTFTWNFGDGSVGKAATGATVSHEYTKPGSFTATVTVSDGELSDSAMVSIVVGNPPDTNKAPVADFAATPTSGPAPLTVAFDGKASRDPDGDSITYALDFGDGSSATTVTASHVYANSGTYTAKLVVKDDKGLASPPATVSITVGGSTPPGQAGVYLTAFPTVGGKPGDTTLNANLRDGTPGVVEYDETKSCLWDTNGDGTFETTGTNSLQTHFVPGTTITPQVQMPLTNGTTVISPATFSYVVQ